MFERFGFERNEFVIAHFLDGIIVFFLVHAGKRVSIVNGFGIIRFGIIGLGIIGLGVSCGFGFGIVLGCVIGFFAAGTENEQRNQSE